jgi:hypothetical protein
VAGCEGLDLTLDGLRHDGVGAAPHLAISGCQYIHRSPWLSLSPQGVEFVNHRPPYCNVSISCAYPLYLPARAGASRIPTERANKRINRSTIDGRTRRRVANRSFKASFRSCSSLTLAASDHFLSSLVPSLSVYTQDW